MSKPIWVLDATEIDNGDLCTFKWHAVHHLNIRTKDSSVIFDRGSLLHDFLEKYYTLKRDTFDLHQDIVEQVVEFGRMKALDYVSIDPTEVTETIFHFREYARYYEFETWTPVFVEQVFMEEFYEDEDIHLYIAGKPDMKFKYQGTNHFAVTDHKRVDRNRDFSMLRNQFMLYAYANKVDTVIVNAVGFQKTLKPKDRFVRQTFVYSPEILEEWRWDTIQLAKEMLIAQEAGIYRRNRTSCEKWNGCFLHNYCKTKPQAREFLIGGGEYVIGEAWDVTKRLEGERK
jgi:hypothetical protein